MMTQLKIIHTSFHLFTTSQLPQVCLHLHSLILSLFYFQSRFPSHLSSSCMCWWFRCDTAAAECFCSETERVSGALRWVESGMQVDSHQTETADRGMKGAAWIAAKVPQGGKCCLITRAHLSLLLRYLTRPDSDIKTHEYAAVHGETCSG